MSLFNDLKIRRWNRDPFLRDLEKGLFTREYFEGKEKNPKDAVIFEPTSPVQEVLLRLFIEGTTVAEAEVRKALPESSDDLLAIGLLNCEEGEVFSKLRIRPAPEGYFADDFPARLLRHAEDFVMGVAPTTRMVRSLIPPTGPGSVLDLCCGGGWLALNAVEEGVEVVGTDLNPRALEVAGFNAALNAIEGVDWREGKWFEPVKGETFDLIVSNPPFVITPGSQAIALDTPDNDLVLPTLLGGMAEHLNEGGFACFLLDWPFVSVESWDRIPLMFLPQAGVQSYLFEVQRKAPFEYSAHWVGQDPRFEKTEVREQELARWVRYFEKKGYIGVSSGFVVMRKCRSGDEWTHSESRQVRGFNARTPDEILRIFAGHSWVKKNQSDCLDIRFGAPEGIRQSGESLLVDGDWEPESIKLTSPGMVAYDGHVDTALLKIIEAASASKTIREILTTLAEQVSSTPDAIAGRVRVLVEELVGLGLLTPPSEMEE